MMNSDYKIVCLPVGERWSEASDKEFRKFKEDLSGAIELTILEPAYSEVDILDRLKQIESQPLVFLLLVVLQGGSARQIVLAAARSGRPVGIWCYNEKHSLASSALAAEGLRQISHPFVLLHGTCSDDLENSLVAASAKYRLENARIGKIGPTHFNLVSVDVAPLLVYRRFGSWIVSLSISELRHKFDSIEKFRIVETALEFKDRYAISADDQVVKKSIALYLAMKDIGSENRLDALVIDSWQEILPYFGITPDLLFIDDDLVLSTEGDVVVAITLLVGKMITKSYGYVGDLYSLDEKTGELVLMHCAGPAALHSKSDKMEIVSQSPPGPIGTSGDILAPRPILANVESTLLILHGAGLDRMHIVESEIVKTNFPDQMNVHVRVEGDPQIFRKKLAGNHYIVFPGRRLEAWQRWAEWSGIVFD